MPYSNPREPKTDLKASISECGIVTLVNVDGIKTITRLYNEMNQTKGPVGESRKGCGPELFEGSAMRWEIVKEPPMTKI